jgi:hypothetical protein
MLKEIGLQPKSTSGDGKETGQRVDCIPIADGLFAKAIANMPEEISLPWVHVGYPQKAAGAKKDNPGTLRLALADKGELQITAKWSDCEELLKRGFVLTLKAEEAVSAYALKMVDEKKGAQIPQWVQTLMIQAESKRKAQAAKDGTDATEIAVVDVAA